MLMSDSCPPISYFIEQMKNRKDIIKNLRHILT